MTAIEKASTCLPCNCSYTKIPANHCSMCASPARVGPKVVVIRLAVSFGLVLVTYKQPRGGSCPRDAESRRDGRRGGVDHILWRKNRQNTRDLLVKVSNVSTCWINLNKPSRRPPNIPGRKSVKHSRSGVSFSDHWISSRRR